MNQKLETPAQIHADHRYWHSDLSMWNDDIEQWQQQFETALGQLKEIEEQVRHHGNVLQNHVTLNEKIANGIEFHEKNLAASISKGSELELDDHLLQRHAEQAAAFSRQRDAHERIKKFHHVAMAHVAALKAAMDAAM